MSKCEYMNEEQLCIDFRASQASVINAKNANTFKNILLQIGLFAQTKNQFMITKSIYITGTGNRSLVDDTIF